MGDILKFSRRRSNREEEIFDQASLWIAKMSRGLNADETEQLQGWLGEQRNREVLFKMAAIWDKMDHLQSLAGIFQFPEPEPKVEPQTAAPSPKSSQPRPQSKRARFSALVLSASVAALLMVALVFTGLTPTTPEEIYKKTLATAAGDTASFDLQDGSHILLNTNSRLQVQFSNEERLLILEQGELSINVAHDFSRPLSVITGNRVVQAVGTIFNVHMRDDQVVDIVVTEGKVRVKEVLMEDRGLPVGRLPETAMTLVGGEKVSLGSANESVIKVRQAEIAVDLGWRQGNLIFRGETLEQAMAEVGRYTDVEFEIKDSDIRHKRIAGLFKIGDLDGLLLALDKNFQVSSEWVNEKKIVLKAYDPHADIER